MIVIVKNFIYITTITFLLIGGAIFFGGWAFAELNYALNDFETTNQKINLATVEMSRPIVVKNIATSTPDLTLTFPKAGQDLYIGCHYQIVWQASSTIESISSSLVDAGTQKPAGPIASGLAPTTTAEKLESIPWSIGQVWPGEYFILVSNINGINTKEKSAKFMISSMPKDLTSTDQKSLCQTTGGDLMSTNQ